MTAYTPEEIKSQWREIVESQRLIHINHITSKNERSEMKKIKKNMEENVTQKKCFLSSTYDRLFHHDSSNMIGLNNRVEKLKKNASLLSSSAYGHRLPLDEPLRRYFRIERMQREFYRENGITNPFDNLRQI
ncbi:uncharacterized protein LOC136091544 isoform X1 [Hydra vulgaris]|uniref:Uncharacterized protein LOC136091544 isoform X1 n=1 Tax=Hydra vulgaris TaxID=6087 RepID=A0ABM4DL69_HYDVU